MTSNFDKLHKKKEKNSTDQELQFCKWQEILTEQKKSVTNESTWI